LATVSSVLVNVKKEGVRNIYADQSTVKVLVRLHIFHIVQKCGAQ